ncbi:MAG: cellobiose phosphorylase, partial [Clostridia bacterium]|nr:cellobiose phosphorylase [Clostridia bacterium]
MYYDFNTEEGTVSLYELEIGKDWSNQLFNKTGYITSVTHYGATYSRYLNQDAVLVNYNNQVSVLYLRDVKTKKYWNIGGFPSMNPSEEYQCTHGQDYSRVSSVSEGIEASIEYRVHSEDTREVWKVTLKNRTEEEREIDLFASTSLDMGGFAQPFYYNMPTTSATEFVAEGNGVFCENKNPFRPHEVCSGYILSSAPIFAYDGNYEKFVGFVGSMARPYTLQKGLDCGNSTATVRGRGGVLQNRISLNAGEEKCVYFVLGLTTDKQKMTERFQNVEKECTELFETNGKEIPYGSVRVRCPEPQINRVMNYWAEHQVRYCMLGKKAVRDNAQLAMAMLNCDTERAKATIEECIVHQYSDGHSVLLWYPIVENTVYSDPSTWLTFAICEYIKESGDVAYLDKKFAYLDGGEGSVYEHLQKAVEWFTAKENRGPNGLPKIYHADWNDALNIPDDNAESVLMAMLICKAYKEIASLARFIGEEEYAAEVEEYYEALKKRTNEVAFNGEYYVRAFSKFGVVGDKTCENGGKIYVNPQSWSILSEVCPEEYLESVLASVAGMETEEGVPMCTPPYAKYDESVGRMSGML